ncbi:MAG: hypothetical protein A2508_03370 [Candidatus Lambdaproteobacteria bacterium RIFOXYD12_FULL_49_8]|uniref:Response regulatory domain-containing protein n=1 Tax=Candidatus Lambdaproteobacteria bacterium RIFOXYD2_FULL_50_16 TaxID=1817772 RepID=A0A1F6G8B0_9PROT|nr:MAG: hypothetical protein A2527_00620 [Candidatus Lambdaproteobacteria bacterium RIFOXYD2_FULL_50_16]OGG96344.1 MAG: hypothetical protein A2508_03370 [Candidatus Lambdaproteobacteria bacterium RIFOXYD12_FULL_49_8]
MDPNLKILIVDDSKPSRSLMAKVLDAMSLPNHLEAETVMEAVGLLQAGGIGLILLDWNMPDISGLDLLANLKANPALKQIPVIMVSANGDLFDVKEAMSLGAADYLVKPINAELLKEKIARATQPKPKGR